MLEMILHNFSMPLNNISGKYTKMDLQVFSAQHLKPLVFCIADTTCRTDAVFPVPGIPET